MTNSVTSKITIFAGNDPKDISTMLVDEVHQNFFVSKEECEEEWGDDDDPVQYEVTITLERV